jgi:tetratricopeptide (TPR) repeat protein
LPAWLIAILLVLLTIAIYWPATRCDFFNTDDPVNVTANVQVRKGLTMDSIKEAFLDSQHTLLWQPLTTLSHTVVFQVFGLNPWGHHLGNVLLHALNAGLVFALLQRMTGVMWRSLLVAALFAVHPLRVEPVAWVTERREVLSTFFGLLALIAYARYVEQAEGRKQKAEMGKGFHVSRFTFHASSFYLLSLFFFAFGLMSKPTLVTWPFVMLLLDYWPLRRFELSTLSSQPSTMLRLVTEKIPFFVFAVAASLVTIVVQKRGGALAAGESLALSARIGNALISYCRYLWKMIWPSDLAAYYPHPGHWSLGMVLLAGGLILGISGLVWVSRRRYPFLLMGWLWYCGTLVPMSQVIQTATQSMADRWTYIPSLGLLILTVWGAYELTRRWRYQVPALSVAGSGVILLCVALTRQQIGYWRNSETVCRHALEVTEDNPVVRSALGAALVTQGRIDEAIRQFQEAIRLRPDYVLAHYNLGVTFGKKGQIDDAIRQFQEAIRLRPDYDLPHGNLGAAFYQKGQIDDAIRQFQALVQLKPYDAEAHCSLGAAFVKKGQIDEAIRQFQEAVRLSSDSADTHFKLGTIYYQQGRTVEAIRQFQETIRLKSDHEQAHNNLGAALGLTGQIDEAIRQFQAALSIKPDYADARRNLDAMLATKARFSQPQGARSNP